MISAATATPTLRGLVERFDEERRAWHRLPDDTGTAEFDRIAEGTWEATEEAMATAPIRSAEDALAALDWLEANEVLVPGDFGSSKGRAAAGLVRALRAYLARV